MDQDQAAILDLSSEALAEALNTLMSGVRSPRCELAYISSTW